MRPFIDRHRPQTCYTYYDHRYFSSLLFFTTQSTLLYATSLAIFQFRNAKQRMARDPIHSHSVD